MVIKRLGRALPGCHPPAAPPQKRSVLPPVPRSLRSQLKQYPEHIERLQLALHGVSVARTTRRPRVEMAVWAIDDRLSRFLAEARQELDAAVCSGDPERLARAKETEAVMAAVCRKNAWMGDEVFAAWFRVEPGPTR
ncbi:hypothetical protein [Stenotrophomonas sp. PS02289]|uniref:hypothetical protein n=1 Tax=Stenotrophomonas sp. PS02289 TaxID=2991422 RepID=UPI00249BC664|nr:hypothetical protein [Stenotrophomonas sp. PS02289]